MILSSYSESSHDWSCECVAGQASWVGYSSLTFRTGAVRSFVQNQLHILLTFTNLRITMSVLWRQTELSLQRYIITIIITITTIPCEWLLLLWGADDGWSSWMTETDVYQRFPAEQPGSGFLFWKLSGGAGDAKQEPNGSSAARAMRSKSRTEAKRRRNAKRWRNTKRRRGRCEARAERKRSAVAQYKAMTQHKAAARAVRSKSRA